MELNQLFGGERHLKILKQGIDQKENLTSEQASHCLKQCDDIIRSNPELREQVNELKSEIKRKSGSKGCYIATATYGDYDHPHVLFFRKFRDEFLYQFSIGRIFIDFYYNISPFLSKIIDRNRYLKQLSKLLLDSLVTLLSKEKLQICLEKNNKE